MKASFIGHISWWRDGARRFHRLRASPPESPATGRNRPPRTRVEPCSRKMKESYVQVEPGEEDDFGLEGWAEGGKNEAKHENGLSGHNQAHEPPFQTHPKPGQWGRGAALRVSETHGHRV